MVATQGPATAETGAARTTAKFRSSLEAEDPQPDWSNATEDSSGVVQGSSDETPGMRTEVGGGPSEAFTAKPNVGFSGVRSLHYAGHQTSKKRGYAHNKVFDVNIPVASTTTLSYKIFPALMDQNLGKGLPSPSTFVSVDLAFDDGTYLRDMGAEDQHRFPLTARGQGTSKRLYANQWNAVQSRIGQVAAGKTITRILVDYDNPTTGKGEFEGWIDDIVIDDESLPAAPEHLSDWVVTTRGTDSNRGFSRGNNIPATAVPHGFNFWVPVTDAETIRWMYQYQEANNDDNLPELQALSLSHQPYPWGGERNTFQVMPAAGGEPPLDRKERALSFHRDHEIAKPYYYGVTFDNGVQAEIAPADRAAIMRFTFPGDTSSLVFDNLTNDGGITLYPDEEVLTGYTDVNTDAAHRMFIYATFDRPVKGTGRYPDSERPDVSGYYRFDTSGDDQTDKTVTMRIATSLISVEQAKHNLELEIPADTTFESVKERARDLWDEKLGVITDVKGATRDQLTTLYSSLYRLNLYPNRSHENTGTAEKPVYRHASQFAPPVGESTPTRTGARIEPGIAYRVSNFWDTYRTSWPADVLFYPGHTGEMIDGALTQYVEGGLLDTAMVGSSSDIAFADAYVKGLTNFDVELAYEAAIKNAMVAPPTDRDAGRQGLQQSLFLGYTPASVRAGLSEALENYLNDFGIGQMAERMAKHARGDRKRELLRQARYFRDRSQDYVHMFDPEVGFFQGRNADGSRRLSPEEYDPRVWGCDYTETNGWGMAFSVPHDGQGLANLYGGRKGLEDKLDAYFSNPETAEFPGCYGDVIHEMREAAYVQMGQFGISNQPAHHIPYMYNYAGMPAKTQAKVREALSRLFLGSEIGQGYPGDEDTGELSAWYVFSALGFYPLHLGTEYYAIGSPLFTSATINLENGKKIVVEAPNNSPENVYVRGLRVNGKPYDKTYISHHVLTDGAVLTFDMGPKPSRWGTGTKSLPPSITTGEEPPNPLQDLTGPTRGSATSSEGDAGRLFDDTSQSTVWFGGADPTVTWSFAGGYQRTARYYTLTSGDEAGDPTGWTLEGSRDGKRWRTLDRRTGQEFRWRNETRVFEIDDPAPYAHYRLRLDAGGAKVSLAEVELLGTVPVDEGDTLAASLSPRQTLTMPSDRPVQQELTLEVTVTAPGTAEVDVRTEVPEGWTVEPAEGTITVESGGRPTKGRLPLTVTIPAGTDKGDYMVAATATTRGAVPVRAPATIEVNDRIEFSPGTEEESRWLLDEGDSQVNGAGERFADNDRYFVYRFAVPEGVTGATVTMEIDNQFRVQAGADGENWTQALIEERPIRDGSNREERSVDLTPFLGEDGVAYVKVSDSHPEDGWGGRVARVAVSMTGS
ncbi:MAG TPA: GH92 family glycosyl hydrolase [Actinopolymorphaceae bacterium]